MISFDFFVVPIVPIKQATKVIPVAALFIHSLTPGAIILSFPKDEEKDLSKDLERVLYTEEQIHERVGQLGREISDDYRGKSLVLISILKGGILFLADMTRAITIPHAFDLMGASSYKGARSSGRVIITKDTELDLQGRDILLVEDILDTGHTLSVVIELLKIQDPASVEVCCLLKKQRERKYVIPLRYTGFEITDEYVVGYGLDFNENYRNLSGIGVLKPEIYLD